MVVFWSECSLARERELRWRKKSGATEVVAEDGFLEAHAKRYYFNSADTASIFFSTVGTEFLPLKIFPKAS